MSRVADPDPYLTLEEKESASGIVQLKPNPTIEKRTGSIVMIFFSAKQLKIAFSYFKELTYTCTTYTKDLYIWINYWIQNVLISFIFLFFNKEVKYYFITKIILHPLREKETFNNKDDFKESTNFTSFYVLTYLSRNRWP